jgi:hypothetical protein
MFDENEMTFLIEQAEINLETGWDDENAFRIAEAAYLHGAHIARSETHILMNRKQESIKKFLDKLLDPEGLGHAVTQEVRENARELRKWLN